MKKKKSNKPLPKKSIAGKTRVQKESTIGLLNWALPAILIFTGMLYIRVLFNGFVNWDDEQYILQNPFIHEFSFNSIKAIFSSFYYSNYHPLTTLTYLIEYSLYGVYPLPYHLLNIVLHLMNIWIVYLLIEKLCGERIPALIVALLFAIHPLHVESVAWISERKDVLYGFFYLLSLLMYLRYLERGRKMKQYINVLLLFVASLLSKSAAVTLPVLLIAMDIYKGRKFNFKLFTEKIPFFLLSLLFGILALLSQKATESLNELSTTYSFIEKIFLYGYAIAFYVVKAIVPTGLSLMHYFPYKHNGWLPWEYYAGIPFLGLLVFVLLKCKPLRKEVVFSFMFFLIALSVMIYVPMGNALTSERYTYIPYIGLFFLAGKWLAGMKKKNIRNVAYAATGIFILFFSWQTYIRIGAWKDGGTLFTDVIEKNPQLYYGYLVRGNIKSKNGDLKGALEDMNMAVRLDSINTETYNYRAAVHFKLHDIKSAKQDYNTSIRLDPAKAESYNNRGLLYYSIKETQTAIDDFNKAIQLKPGLAEAYNNRGKTYYDNGDTASALHDYIQAIRLDNELAEAYNNRGQLYFTAGYPKAALKDYNEVIKLKPMLAEAYNNRGMAFISLGDAKAAILDYDKSIQLDTTLAEAYNNRGNANYNAGNAAAALSDFDKAIKLKPGLVEAYNNRGVIKAKTGDLGGALADVNMAIVLSPNYAEAYSYRGNIKSLQKDFKGSIEDFTFALKLKPNDYMTYYSRGMARLSLNDKAGACEDWNRSLNMGNTMAKEMMEKYCK